jgi:hypothetical protein
MAKPPSQRKYFWPGCNLHRVSNIIGARRSGGNIGEEEENDGQDNSDEEENGGGEDEEDEGDGEDEDDEDEAESSDTDGCKDKNGGFEAGKEEDYEGEGDPIQGFANKKMKRKREAKKAAGKRKESGKEKVEKKEKVNKNKRRTGDDV